MTSRRLFGRLALFSALLMIAFAAASFISSAQAADRSPVGYTEAISHPVQGSVTLPGSVVSRTVSTVASEVGGLVVEMPVREGDRVKQGDVLIALRQRSLRLQLAASQATLKEEEAHRRFAELNYQRMQGLFEDAVISRQELDDAKYQLDARVGRVERLHAEIERLMDDLERTVTRAPFDGIVIEKHAELGEWVSEGGDIVQLLSMDTLEVQVDVPERYYGHLQRRARAEVRLETSPDVRLQAPIAVVIPRAHPQARTFPIRLRLPANERRLAVGMVVQVTLPLGDSQQAVMVPKDAVLTDASDPRIFILTEDDRVRPVSVEMGRGKGQWIEVRGQIVPGDRVVTRGNERLRPGQEVEPSLREYPLP
ncbi:MAG TPA: efflux RND transporter periplasmic adaptor subunit [Acidobacteriota bacterium]|nr:efflux RND transporter periplasmic adaptor subunit [Acidobacteriota bacterium]